MCQCNPLPVLTRYLHTANVTNLKPNNIHLYKHLSYDGHNGNRQYTYNATMRRLHETTVAV